jgi:hypothetical protein
VSAAARPLWLACQRRSRPLFTPLRCSAGSTPKQLQGGTPARRQRARAQRLVGVGRELNRRCPTHRGYGPSGRAVVASNGMSLWLLLTLMGLVKLLVASLMVWLPYRSDSAMSALGDESQSDSDDEGGSKTLPGTPADPHPRLPLPNRPRRGPHGSPSPPSPARVRKSSRRVIARSLVQR